MGVNPKIENRGQSMRVVPDGRGKRRKVGSCHRKKKTANAERKLLAFVVGLAC